jgi:hypothetical protein
MNSALIDAFLDLVPIALKQSYKQIRMENPNSIFCEMFSWFIKKYSRTSAANFESNCISIDLEWLPSKGFELLVACLFQLVTFANLAKHPIPNNDIIGIGIHIIYCTDLFPEEYKAWIICNNSTPTNMMDFSALRTLWDTTVNIASFTAILALQPGYGMNAVEDDASAASLTNAVSNFGRAYAATQESLCNNNTSINAVHGQIQMLCNIISNKPLSSILQYHCRELYHGTLDVCMVNKVCKYHSMCKTVHSVYLAIETQQRIFC